jgi:hypothetical protein
MDRYRHYEALCLPVELILVLPLAVIELLARVGSIVSITLLILLFMDEAFHPAEISSNEWVGLLFPNRRKNIKLGRD